MSTLHTTDPDRAMAFYNAVFGWHAEAFGPSGGQVTLCRLPGYVGGEPQQPVARDVVVPPRDTPGFRNAILADRAGAVFSISALTAKQPG